MNIFADTSFLIPAFLKQHPNHERTRTWIRKALQKKNSFGISSQSISEVYSVLTTLPVSPRILPGTALQMIHENLLSKVQIIELEMADYREAVRMAAEKGLSGGIIFDILIAICFTKFKGDVLLTYNTKDFVRILPEKAELFLSP